MLAHSSNLRVAFYRRLPYYRPLPREPDGTFLLRIVDYLARTQCWQRTYAILSRILAVDNPRPRLLVWEVVSPIGRISGAGADNAGQ